MRNRMSLFVSLALAAGGLVYVGCDDRDDTPDLPTQEQVEQGARDAGNTARDAARDAGSAIKEGARDAAGAVERGAGNVRDRLDSPTTRPTTQPTTQPSRE